METKSIVVIKGDGIGPDIVEESIKVLKQVEKKYPIKFDFIEYEAGGIAIDKYGIPLPAETLEAAKKADAVILGAVGGPQWDNISGDIRPEQALLGLRESLGLFANLRPAILHRQLKAACPLKEEIIGDSLDILIVRELTSGIYFGKRGRVKEDKSAYDTLYYNEKEIERILHVGFEAAMARAKKACVVDKANILETSRLWREVALRVIKDYPEVELSFMYVDNASMQLIRNPKQFDVIITTNMFGDIISDEASMLTGSIGMLPSASIGGRNGLYEPIHGSAPDIAGKNLANPIATILSVAMMLRYSFKMEEAAKDIEYAVDQALTAGYRTQDINSAGMKLIGTREMGDVIVSYMK